MTLTITFEKFGDLELKSYEGVITLDKITNIYIENYNIEGLIELVGKDRLLDCIGKDEVAEYFGLIEKDEE